ncbi:MAG: hypothetical protein IJU52_04345 [Clostridia bacterium]|nr:hypothetical protein [Clostridia bacterium]
MKTANYSESIYVTDASPACSYFVLSVHATADGGSTMQLSELRLYGEAQT